MVHISSLSTLLCLAISIRADPIGVPFIKPVVPVRDSPFIHSPIAKVWKNTPELSPEMGFKQAPAGSNYCLTKDCVNAASDMIRAMDDTADPCTDFYQFACGNFIKETVIPEDKTSVSAISMLRDKRNKRLMKIFESESNTLEPAIFNS